MIVDDHGLADVLREVQDGFHHVRWDCLTDAERRTVREFIARDDKMHADAFADALGFDDKPMKPDAFR